MAGRTVGAGRGAVFAGGVRYDEGAEIPKDVEVDESVFTDVDAEVGNVAAAPPSVVTAKESKSPAKSSG